jgi:hypothetical protein
MKSWICTALMIGLMGISQVTTVKADTVDSDEEATVKLAN